MGEIQHISTILLLITSVCLYFISLLLTSSFLLIHKENMLTVTTLLSFSSFFSSFSHFSSFFIRRLLRFLFLNNSFLPKLSQVSLFLHWSEIIIISCLRFCCSMFILLHVYIIIFFCFFRYS